LSSTAEESGVVNVAVKVVVPLRSLPVEETDIRSISN